MVDAVGDARIYPIPEGTTGIHGNDRLIMRTDILSLLTRDD
jgi:hypothetical protein